MTQMSRKTIKISTKKYKPHLISTLQHTPWLLHNHFPAFLLSSPTITFIPYSLLRKQILIFLEEKKKKQTIIIIKKNHFIRSSNIRVDYRQKKKKSDETECYRFSDNCTPMNWWPMSKLRWNLMCENYLEGPEYTNWPNLIWVTQVKEQWTRC